jgi:hypothetical protein
MSDVVRELLLRIDQLPDEDRLLLEERLAELADADWKREAEQARDSSRLPGSQWAAAKLFITPAIRTGTSRARSFRIGEGD